MTVVKNTVSTGCADKKWSHAERSVLCVRLTAVKQMKAQYRDILGSFLFFGKICLGNIPLDS